MPGTDGIHRACGSTMVTYDHRFRYEIFNIAYNQIIIELNNSFVEKSNQLLRCVACVDLKNSFANFHKDNLVKLAKMYADDFSIYEISLSS